MQAATNGIRFAQDPEFAKAAREAGLRIAYLQFDGVGEAANAHRKVGNLFDVKLRAIENCYAAGIDVCLVVTVVNTVNNDQVGADRQVRARELRQDQLRLVPAGVVHRPRRGHVRRGTARQALHAVAPGRGPQDADRRRPSRCATGFRSRPSSALSDVTDLLQGPGADWGTLKCGCHPNCGIGTAFMVSKRTREWAPLGAFIDVEQFLKDARTIADSARGPALTKLQAALSLLRNYTPAQAPRGFRLDRPRQEVRQAERRPPRRQARRAARTATASRTSGC